MRATQPELEVPAAAFHAAFTTARRPRDAPLPPNIGRYAIARTLGVGGMATVYLASVEGKPCAIKRIHPHLSAQREFVEMFMDEARIAARIKHPNVCVVHEWGEADCTFFLAMELVIGETLYDAIRALAREGDEPLRIRLALRVVADACRGLHAAHELRDDDGTPLDVVHRDVSPLNIVIAENGVAKVLDFGVATAARRVHQTVTGAVKGRFAYMAPEQLHALPVDRRADVWSLGVVLFEAVTARALFRRASEGDTVHAVMGREVPSVRSIVPFAPPALEAIVEHALASDRTHRFATAEDLADALEEALDELGGFSTGEVSRCLHERFPTLAERRAQAAASLVAVPPVKRRRRVVPIVATAIALCAAVPGGLHYAGARDLSAPKIVASAPSLAPPVVEAPSAPIRPAEVEPPIVALPIEPPRLEPEPPTIRRAQSTTVETGHGMVDLVTHGGWAEVWFRDRRLGHTPGRFELPAGRHHLVLKDPSGRELARAAVRIVDGQVARLRVELP